MTSPSNSDVQNLLPVQAYFGPDGSFQTFIGQGQPFYASVNPSQSGLDITNSTINSTTIGAVVPSTGAFTNISTTTGTITTPPASATDIVNYLALQSYAVGISWKAPVTVATAANITLSGTQTIDGIALVVGNTVLVKDQSTASQNGIYTVQSGAWTYATGCTTWEQYVSALVFVEYGTLAGSAWYCTAQPGGTLGTTAMTWSNFSTAASYSAGTGLTLTGYQFSITPVGTAGTYGSASSVPVVTTNASGQVSSVTNTAIAISNSQVSGLGTMSTQNAGAVAITGGTIDATTIGGTTAGAVTGTTITANTQFTGAGTGLTGTASGLSIGGNAATATSATTATNLAGGAAGSVPYQASSGSTSMLAAGTNGQVLTLASGVPSWATPTTGTVTSVGGTGTVSGISLSGAVTSSGDLTLGGSLDLSSPPAIGGTAPNTGAFTTLDATSFATNVAAAGLTLSGTSLTADGTDTNINMTLTPKGSGGLGINGTPTGDIAGSTLTAKFCVKQDESGPVAGFVKANNSSAAPGSTIYGCRSRGTLASPAIVQNDDTLVSLLALGFDGTDLAQSAEIDFQVDGVPGANDMPGRIVFKTSPDGTQTTVEAMRIDSTQTVTAGKLVSSTSLNLGGTLAISGSNGTSGQVLTSAGAGAAPTWTTPTSYATITDDTTTNATRYPLFADATTGNLTTEYTSSTKWQFNPSTGYMTVTGLTSPIINNPTVTNYVESVVAIGTVTSSSTLSLTNGTVQTATLTASTACTFTMPTATAGKSFILLLKQAASTGNGTATFTGVKWSASGAPTITATAGKMDILTFVADGTNWYGSYVQGYTP